MENLFFDRFGSIDKSVPTPLYFQIKIAISQMIRDGVLRVGDMLPPEGEIASFLNVSRPTVRQALNELVSEELLVRHQGRGTYVSTPKIEARYFQQLQSFNDEMRQKKIKPSTIVLQQKCIDAKPMINMELEMASTEKLIYLQRLRCADDIPILLAHDYLCFARFPKILEVDFTDNSLMDSMHKLYNKSVAHVVRYVEAINCPEKEARLLHIEPGDAVCKVTSCTYADDKTALEYGIDYHRGDRAKFRLEMFGHNNV